MKRATTNNKLAGIPEPRKLAHCVNITRGEWHGLKDADALIVWDCIKSYISNGYHDCGITIAIPMRVLMTWVRCKRIIDEEIRQ